LDAILYYTNHTMELKTYNETLHDEFEKLIDDLREKVMRYLKNAKHKFHVNYEITQCTESPLSSVPGSPREPLDVLKSIWLEEVEEIIVTDANVSWMPSDE